MLIAPSDYSKLMTKCSDFMIAGQAFRKPNGQFYYQIFTPFELKPSLPHQAATLEKSTSSEQLEFKFIRNTANKIIIIPEKIAKINDCLIAEVGSQNIIYDSK